ncbi:hypothetical protein TPHA_0B02350 [Tetrapisispora phaffii CBS 4417]|uniref:Probable transporter MCH1 n=1 Tax=Tetrapisispora phaffii (strain ATCC 24235 / CBS 4417 / NBRC 1672 / NRRL Y-8282 / UCD 70-5) TaxID=1071381 RepID=G8BPH7_TETPH|nr:hypothetical protein TPHA_0B02350 [Tetrapisispora phaffii CBS 4417]CCE61908.1 hypothetical protein TPHA_0B02350 [Tetrapisispora phaffii CBS 4417]
MVRSNIEHYLSYHIRLSIPKILSNKSSCRVGYIFSLLAAVTSGFVTLISLFTSSWQAQLHYTSKQINTIASVITLSMYLSPCILGVIADLHGPITLNFMAILGLAPSYLYLSYDYNSKMYQEEVNIPISSNFIPILVCFGTIGVATSAMYFSALLTCAKLYPNRNLLSISLPTTFFGLSSLVGSQILRLRWFWNENEPLLNLSRVFKFLAASYVVVGLLAWISTAVLSMLHNQKDEEYGELEALLSVDESYNHQTEIKNKQMQFLKDPNTYYFLISVFLVLGPLETFVANMYMVADLLTSKNSFYNESGAILSVYSFFSTGTRIIAGLITEALTKRNKNLHSTLLIYIVLALFSQLYILRLTITSNGMNTETELYAMSSLSGICNGALFTMYPTLLLNIYGKDLFGTVYGVMMIGPALGATYSFKRFGEIYDSKCSNTRSKASCISEFYGYVNIEIILGFLLSLYVIHNWKKRSS